MRALVTFIYIYFIIIRIIEFNHKELYKSCLETISFEYIFLFYFSFRVNISFLLQF